MVANMEEAEQITSVQRFPHAATVLDINRFADEREAGLALCLKQVQQATAACQISGILQTHG